jgi:hypothetical protein
LLFWAQEVKGIELQVTIAEFKHRKGKVLVNYLTTGFHMNYTNLKFNSYLALCLLLTALVNTALHNTGDEVQGQMVKCKGRG